MNLLSPTVLGAAGVCASPALYQTLVTGGVPLEVAMTRYLVALVLCWVAISLVAALVGEPPAPAARAGVRTAVARRRASARATGHRPVARAG
ncbi:MAG: hypothetical protein ACO1ON_10845, partial [Nocardioides sp.]